MKRMNKKGQAMFEFIIFLPFVIVLFKMFLNIGGAIMAQLTNKNVKRLFLSHLKGSSYFPSLKTLNTSWKSFTEAGFTRLVSQKPLLTTKKPISPCYKISHFWADR